MLHQTPSIIKHTQFDRRDACQRCNTGEPAVISFHHLHSPDTPFSRVVTTYTSQAAHPTKIDMEISFLYSVSPEPRDENARNISCECYKKNQKTRRSRTTTGRRPGHNYKAFPATMLITYNPKCKGEKTPQNTSCGRWGTCMSQEH